MSNKCFDGCMICYTNLSYTNAIINPQKVFLQNLESTKCDGLDLSHADFTDVNVKYASFKNATNLENVDMSGKDFRGCEISFCNLTNTNAVLDLRWFNVDKLWGCELQGATILVDEDFDREQLEKHHVKLGTVSDEYTLIKKKIKSIFETINK